MTRFGITARKFELLLDRYITVTQTMNCVPTFPLTSVILKRHPGLFREFSEKGIQFAIHGYTHTDYHSLPLPEQFRHLKKAMQTFHECSLPFEGFRAPYLRTNHRTLEALRTLEFLYDSSRVISWDVIHQDDYSSEAQQAYKRLLKFYQSKSANDYIALPRHADGFVEIPVSIPDDEAIIERFGIRSPQGISEIWGEILRLTHQRGELFTMQIHPERISLCDQALVAVLQQAKELKPPVWVATLSEIAAWWRERLNFSLKILTDGERMHRVTANHTDKGTLLFKNCKIDKPSQQWSDGYRTTNSKEFVVTSPVRPVVGVSPESSPAAVDFLINEGYVVERRSSADGYGIYLSDLKQFEEKNERDLVERMEHLDVPLLRYSRWPNGAKSALSVTGDIDSVTLTDFALRFIEKLRVRKEKIR